MIVSVRSLVLELLGLSFMPSISRWICGGLSKRVREAVLRLELGREGVLVANLLRILSALSGTSPVVSKAFLMVLATKVLH